MAKDCYPRFLRSQTYRDLLQQAKQRTKNQEAKKAWSGSASRWSIFVVKFMAENAREAQHTGAEQRAAGSWLGGLCRCCLEGKEERKGQRIGLKCVNAEGEQEAERRESGWQSNWRARGSRFHSCHMSCTSVPVPHCQSTRFWYYFSIFL